MNNWRILEDIDKKEKIKNNSAVGSISLNRQGVKNEIFYRGYNGNYEPLESRNKKCIWATSDRRNALKWGNEFDNVKVAKLRLVCKDKITSKFQDSRYDDYDAIELFELAVKKGFKGYWFDDNGAQGICADISCFEVVSENINEVVEEVDNKIDDKQVTEKDMIEQIKKLEKKLQNIYINDNAIRQDAPSIIITPNGTVIDTVDFDTHGDFLDYVYNEIVYGVDDEYDEYYSDEYDEYYSEGYDYATEVLNFMTLNTGDGFYEVRCKVVMERRPSVMQVNLLGEWLEKRIDEEKPIIVFVNGLQKTYEPEDDNYSSRGIIKSIQRSFSTGILENINFDYDGRGWITSTGEIISTNNAPHYEKEHKIKNWSENHVKYNFGYERYIGLPKNRLSFAQYETLTKLLDYFFINKPNVGIRSTAIEINYDMNDKGDFKWKRFSPKTHTTDDIIKLIKRYYTTGRLNESGKNKIDKKATHVRFINKYEYDLNESWNDVYKMIKDEFGTTSTPPKGPAYILPTGEFLDVEKWWNEYYGKYNEDTDEYEYGDEERDTLYKGISPEEVSKKINPGSFPMHSLVQYYINKKLGIDNDSINTTYRLDDENDTLVQNGCIKVNSGETLFDNLYVNLPNKRPTNQALESLDEYIFTQFYKNNKDVLKIYIEDNYWTATKYKRDDYADTKDIIKKITRYYTGAKLEESSVDEKLSIPKYLYHATYKPFLKSIKEKGLGNTSKKMWSDSASGVVYLATDEDVAYSYAETAEWLDDVEDYDKYADNIVILKIDTNKLDKTKFKKDSNVIDGDDTFEYHGVISFEFVEEILDKHHIVESLSGKEKEVIDTLDKYFGQKETYVWSTYILPNGHFLNPENYKKDDAEWQSSLSYEHEDFDFVLDEFGFFNNKVLEDYCIKVNVTFPYVAMPNNRATPEQFLALRKLIDRRDEFEYSFDEISNIVENGSDVYDMKAPLIIILNNSEIAVDLDSTDVNSIVKMISRAYTTGTLLAESKLNIENKIKRYYATGTLVESDFTDFTDNEQFVYHGSPMKIDKFKGDVVWFTDNIHYAREYTKTSGQVSEPSANGYIYKCTIDVKRPFDIGFAGEGVTDSSYNQYGWEMDEEYDLISEEELYNWEDNEDNITDEGNIINPKLVSIARKLKTTPEYLISLVGEDAFIYNLVYSKEFIKLLKSRNYDSITQTEQAYTIGVFNVDKIKIVEVSQVKDDLSEDSEDELDENDYIGESLSDYEEDIDGIIVYRGEERSRINRFDNVDDEGNPVLYNDVGFSGLFFSADEYDVRAYGIPHKYKISNKAKIYKGYSSEEYCDDNNLRDIRDDVLYEISDGHTLKEIEDLFYEKKLDDMNSIYGARQYMARKHLEKQGYDGAHWEYEDDLTPEQYQIWNPFMITYIGSVDEFDE